MLIDRRKKLKEVVFNDDTFHNSAVKERKHKAKRRITVKGLISNYLRGQKNYTTNGISSLAVLKSLAILLVIIFVGYFNHESERKKRGNICNVHRQRHKNIAMQVRFNRRWNNAIKAEFYLEIGKERKKDTPPIYKRDFGGLEISFGAKEEERSYDNPDDNSWHWHMFTDEEDEESVDAYYAFDDDAVRNEDWKDEGRHCRRVEWHKLYNPSCNQLHELELLNDSSTYLGSGFYRDVFLVNYQTNEQDLVFKINRSKNNDFTYDTFEFIRMDALVMERLTASPRIVNIYGHCGTSVLSEFLSKEVEGEMIPGSGKYYGKGGIHMGEKVAPKNKYTPIEKLTLACQMAESIADLHGFRDGVIVHDDLMPSQFLFAADGRIKLNDFNRAEAMLYDENDETYCRYSNGPGGGDFRSPEEYADNILNEKIDVWSMGNMMYGLLTGLLVFYTEEDDKVLQHRIMDGDKAFIDPRYRTRNSKLVDIIQRCWEYDPDLRPDIFEIVKYLREAIEQQK